MPGTVDELNIEINATAQKANDAITRLVGKLDILSNSLGRLKVGNNLSILANGVERLGNAMQTMNNVKTTDFTRLSRNLQTLNNIDTSKLNNLTVNVKHIANAFNGLSGMDKGVEQISILANGIKQLGYKSADKAIANIPLLAISMKKLMEELSTAPKVSRNIIDMTNALAKFTRTGSSGGKAAASLANSFNRISRSSVKMRYNLFGATNGIKSLTRQLLSAAGVAGGFYAVFNGIKDSINIASDLTEVQNVVDVTFGDFKNKIEDLAKVSIPELGMSELTTKQVASRFQAMGTSMGFTQSKMADMSTELTRLTGDMASFYNMEQKAVGEDLESIFTGQTKPLRQYGLDLTEATLQEWALKNGVDANINSMSQMEKTMLRYQYVMANTKAAQGDFIRTADTWANQVRVLKENFKALGSVIGTTFINALKPLVRALNQAMSHIIAFAKVVSNALGKIFGWKYEEFGGGIASDFGDAAESADDLATGTGKAADNIKKMKAGLRAFDELNTINLNNNNSGNGNGNGSGTGVGSPLATDGGQWAKTDSILKDFESDINNLYDLGKHIGDTLTDAMNSIDWNKAYESARNFGKGLADFLNGLISPELFGAVGRTIAGSLNVAIYNALSFGETFDWINLGNSFAEGVTQLFSTLDTEALGKTITVWVRGALKSVSTFLKKTDFEMIGNKIGELLKEMDLIGIAQDLADVLWELFKAAFELLKGMIDVAPVETGLIMAFAGMKLLGLNTLLATKLRTILTGGPVKAAAAEGGKSILSSMSSAWKGMGGIGGILTADVGEVLAKGSAAEIGVTLGTGIIGGILAAFAGFKIGKSIGKFIAPEEFQEYYDNFKLLGEGGFFSEITDDFETTRKAAVSMSRDLGSGPLTEFIAAIDETAEKTDLATNKIVEFGVYSVQMGSIWQDSILKGVKTTGKAVDKGMAEIASKTNSGLSEVGSIMKRKSDSMNSDWEVSTKLLSKTMEVALATTNSNAKIEMNNLTNTMSAGIASMNSEIESGTTSMISRISASAVTMGTTLASQVGTIKSSMNETKNSMESMWSVTTDSISKGITASTRALLTKTTGGMNGIISSFEALINIISKSTNLMITGINASLGKFTTPVKAISLIPNLGRISIPSFATGGFPEDGLFYANHSEMVGKFSNGKTAVANNSQIIEGISAGVRNATAEQNKILMEQNSLLRAILEKETGISSDAIFRSVKQSASDYTKRTGRPAF